MGKIVKYWHPGSFLRKQNFVHFVNIVAQDFSKNMSIVFSDFGETPDEYNGWMEWMLYDAEDKNFFPEFKVNN